MEVNRYDAAKIWRLIGQWVENAPEVPVVTPAVPIPEQASEVQQLPLTTEHTKTPALKRNRARSRTSPSNAFSHLHLGDGHASRQSSPLVTSHVISEADMLPKPAPLSLPPPKQKPAEQKDVSNNVDLVGSDTSAASSYTNDLETEEKIPEESSSDEETLASGQLTARRFSEEKAVDIGAVLAASLPSHLVTKRRPTLSSISQQPSAVSSKTVTRASSSATTQLPDSASLGLPRSMSRHLNKTLPEPTTVPTGRSTRALSNNSGESAANVVRSTSHWNVNKDPEESSASGGDSDDSDIDEDDQALTVESLRARGIRQHHRYHRQRARARQSRSKSRRRGIGSADEKPRRTVSGRQSRSVSAARRGQRSMSKIRTEALLHRFARHQEEVKEMLTSKFGEHLHAIMQHLADEVRCLK